jgi:hypothetical protein
MKKMILTAFTCLLMAGAQAQIVSSRSVSITQEAKAPTEMITYGRVGIGLMSITGDDVESKSKLGYNLAIGFQKSLDTNDLYWGLEAALGSRGFKDKYDDTYSLIAHNIQVSPSIGWKPVIGDDLNLDIHVGAFVSYDFAGTVKEDDESWGLGDTEGYKRFDVGLNPGVGVWYGNYNLDISYQRGFLEMAKDSGIKSQNIVIRLGIAF